MNESSIPKSNIIHAIEDSIGFKKHVKMLLKRNNMDFESFEFYLNILNEKHNAIGWLKQVTRIAYFIDPYDGDEGFLQGIRKVNLYHLKNLLSFSEELTELYNIIVIDSIFIFDDDTRKFIYNWSTYNLDLTGKIQETRIIFPDDFIFWDIDDLIESVYAFLTGDTIYPHYSDNNQDIWLHKKYIPKISDNIKELALKALDKYYFERTRNKTKIYQDELIEIGLIPERVFDWYLDEESKKIFKR